ncbi:MAG: LptF/LptG family permease [Geminicoccaceae bacterium]
MSILGRYVTRIFIGQLSLVLISAVAMLQLFDVMSQADDLLADLGGGVSVVLHYSLLRLPILVTFLLPFSVLIAAVLTFGRLHRHSELVAIQALGMPFLKILSLMLPFMLLLVFLHFMISDQLTPRATRTLAAWEENVTIRKPNDIALWLHDGQDLVSINNIEDNGKQLAGVVIFRRDTEGNLVKQASAERASFAEDGWWLHHVDELAIRPTAKSGEQSTHRQRWATKLQPDVVEDLATLPNALSTAEIRRLLNLSEITSRPLHVYQTWLHKNFAVPLSSLFMVALATASVRGLQRQGGAALNALIGFGGAFLYFIVDGVLTALGEAGSVSPAAAAWLPLLFLATTAGAVLYWVTMPKGRRKPKLRSILISDEAAASN